MKNRRKMQTADAKVRNRRSLITICVTAVIVVGAAITVLSKQLGNSPQQTAPAPATKAVSPHAGSAVSPVAGKNYVTVKFRGQDVQVDPQTGQIKPLTPAEAQQLADGLKRMLNKSTEGLVQEKHPDGSTSIDLQGRFRNVTLARVNADGTIERACVDNPLAAARFFGIDPKLMGIEPDKTGGAVVNSTGQPGFRTPAKKVSQ